MDENEDTTLDLEFKRYLQLLRPYVCQLVDEDVIELCDSWIQRLASCNDKEKILRNKYIFRLCYQLAKGILEPPFLRKPPVNLQPLSDEIDSDDSSTEVECLVINSDHTKTKVLFDSKMITISDTDYLSQEGRTWSGSVVIKNGEKPQIHKECNSFCRQKILCCHSREISENSHKHRQLENYECRANNLVRKLREIKMQNILLQKELLTLKEKSKSNNYNLNNDYAVKVDNCTSPLLLNNDSNVALNSLRLQLQDIQDSRNVLIQTISNLQNELDNFNELKKNQIEDIEAKHKLELIKVRTDTREETKTLYEKKFEDLKQTYKDTITKIQETANNELRTVTEYKDQIVFEKNKLLDTKNMEIDKLKQQIESEKLGIQSMLSKFIEKSTEDSSCEGLKTRNQLLERRLTKLEKAKLKCTKIYESKIAQLQREKHLTECSLQLQLVRQRAQVVSEMTDENQTELNSSLEKLEAKYKEIVANVQATAIQRRIRDQKELETILKAACGLDKSRSQYSNSAHNHNQTFETEPSSLACGNRLRNIDLRKSYGADSIAQGYCLNGEQMVELFDKIYIPQKDDCNGKI